MWCRQGIYEERERKRMIVVNADTIEYTHASKFPFSEND